MSQRTELYHLKHTLEVIQQATTFTGALAIPYCGDNPKVRNAVADARESFRVAWADMLKAKAIIMEAIGDLEK